MGGAAADSFVFASLLAIPAFMNVGNFALTMIGTAVAVVIGFALTFFFGPREQADAEAEDAPRSEALIAEPGTEVALSAPVSGRIIPLSEVADKVFASAAMGSGVGIVPTDGHVYAPVAGKVVAAMKTGHAFGIKTAEGVEVLVHIGLDTVQMKGEGFTSHVTQGAEVARGDLLAVVDLDAVVKAGYDTTTVMVVTNTAKLTEVAPASAGAVSHGDETVLVTL